MTFEQYLREHGYILDRVYKTSHEWVQLAEEWHAQEVKKSVPSVEEIQDIIRPSINYIPDIKKIAEAIRALCEGKEGGGDKCASE